MSVVLGTGPDGDAELAERHRELLANALDIPLNGVGYSAQFRGGGMSQRTKNSADGSKHRRKPGRSQFDAEQKFRIVLESLKSPEPNIQICRRYGISEPTLYKWRQQFLDGGRMYLSGAARANLADLAAENRQLRKVIGETLSALENSLRGNRTSARRVSKGARPARMS